METQRSEKTGVFVSATNSCVHALNVDDPNQRMCPNFRNGKAVSSPYLKFCRLRQIFEDSRQPTGCGRFATGTEYCVISEEQLFRILHECKRAYEVGSGMGFFPVRRVVVCRAGDGDQVECLGVRTLYIR